jgi:DNA-binding NarL/FixJ family response regulator
MDFGASGFIPRRSASRRCARRFGACSAAACGRRPTSISSAPRRIRDTAALLARLATLTPQQVRVLMMLSEGLLNKQIAYELSVSEATVKAHVSAILQKLGVESRTQAVIAAAKIEQGYWPQGAG